VTERSETSCDAIVVGGGIGGLTAALALAHKGLTVTVLEKASAFSEVGAGIQVSPNGARVLFALGLEVALSQRAFRPEAVELRSWRTGAQVLRLPLGEDVSKRFGAPYLHLHRADLHRVLVSAVRDTPQITLHLGAGCERVAQGEHVASVVAGARHFEAPLVVGADGIKSVVRAGLFGENPPRFTGCVAWRGLVPAEAVQGADVRPVAGLWMGPGAHFVHYYVRGGQLVNVVAVVEKAGWEIESWTQRGERDELIADFAGWHPTVQALLRGLDADQCFKWALFDRDPLPRWTRSRVTLLGDACHPMLPFMAQGACMAIEDAMVLAQCVDRDPIPQALLRYEQLRQRRTAEVQLTSRRNATLYHFGGLKAVLRDLALRCAGGMLASRSDALFGYDALAVGRR